MLAIRDRAWQCTALAALGLAVALAVSGPCAGHVYHHAETVRPTVASPPATPIVIHAEPTPEEVHKAAEDEAAHRAIFGQQPEVWTFWLMVLTSLLTIGLWFATWANASATNRSASIAERALVDLERPYVFVRFGDPGLEMREIQLPDKGVEFHSRYNGWTELLFSNYGRSPAILKDALIVFDRTAGRHAMPYAIDPVAQTGPAFPSGTISANGEPHKMTWAPYSVYGHESLEADSLTTDRFFCLGYLRYEDVLGGRYVLGFCAYFEWDRFILEGGPEFNYFRTEIDPRDRVERSRRKWLSFAR